MARLFALPVLLTGPSSLCRAFAKRTRGLEGQEGKRARGQEGERGRGEDVRM